MDYDKLEAGRELDALVAEKVMGWNFDPGLPDRTGFWYPPTLDEEIGDWPSKHGYQVDDAFLYVPLYSTEIHAVWEVVEWLAERGLVRVSNGDGDSCDFDFMPDGRDEILYGHKLNMAGASCNSWPLAICRAALKAVAG